MQLTYRVLVYVLILGGALVGPAAFWQGGVMEREATFAITHYTVERPILNKIFDPYANDLGTYQARELSYFVDYIDAQFYRFLVREFEVPLFVPLSAVVSSLALVLVFMWGLRHTTASIGLAAGALLLGCFLSSFLFMSTMGIFYRSSKALVTIAVLACLFHVRRVQQQRTHRDGTSRLLTRDAIVAFSLAVFAGLVDRQGFFYVAAGCVMLAVHYWWTRQLQDLLVAFLVAAGVLQIYNLGIAPITVHTLNGYWPDFSYQLLPREQIPRLPIYALLSLVLMEENALMLFGGGKLVTILILSALAMAAFAISRHLAGRDRVNYVISRLEYEPDRRIVIYGVLAFGLHVVMFALMIARLRNVYFSVDHRYWYYPMPYVATVLFGSLLALNAWMERIARNRRWLVCVALSVIILSNLAGLDRHRQIMREGPWFGEVYGQSEALKSSLRNGAADALLDRYYKPFFDYHKILRSPRSN